MASIPNKRGEVFKSGDSAYMAHRGYEFKEVEVSDAYGGYVDIVGSNIAYNNNEIYKKSSIIIRSEFLINSFIKDIK